MEKLDQKAIWLFFFQYLKLSFFLALLFILLFFNFIESFKTDSLELLRSANYLFLIILFILVWAGFSYLMSWLADHFYRYELTEETYRAERGIIWKRYISIPYNRIQNVDIYRGILDRLLGLSDIQIHTAGYGAANASEERLHGLDRQNAEEIRGQLIQKAKKSNQEGI